MLDIFDGSNMERSTALQNAIEFIIDNPLVLVYGNGWDHYSSLVITRVHNDFFQLLIKWGIFGLILFIFLLARVFYKLAVPISAIFSLSLFSSLLGGIAWLGGLYWLFSLAILFNKNNYQIK
jgi:O-antigen ligase